MPRDSAASKADLQPSLLERLVDLNPRVTEESPLQSGYTWQQYLDAIKQDVQNLLNTRQSVPDDALSDFPEARSSILSYGFPEFDGAYPQSIETQRRLKAALEQTIGRFEPRLVNVVVVPVALSASSRVARFRIEAFVNTTPRPRRVVFDGSLDVDRLECRLEEGL